MTVFFRSGAIFCFLIAVMVGCTLSKKEGEDHILEVVTTTGMLYDAVLNVAGDRVNARAIMGPGVDPHLYKATQGDLTKLRNADVVIYNGLYLEGKMEEILEKLGKTKPTIAAAEALDTARLMSAIAYENAYDPHVWFDVSMWKEVVREIGLQLMTIDTANASYYRTNTDQYLAGLDTLDQYVRKRISEVPEDQRILVTAHDAFGYFGKAYGVEVKGLQGISTVSDFGLKDIANIIDLIIEKKIKAIFVETSVSDRSIKAVITGCREQGHDVTIGGYLYSDAMGEFGTFEGTYFGMVKSNIDTIVEALK